MLEVAGVSRVLTMDLQYDPSSFFSFLFLSFIFYILYILLYFYIFLFIIKKLTDDVALDKCKDFLIYHWTTSTLNRSTSNL